MLEEHSTEDGDRTIAVGLDIRWQHGLIEDGVPNGCFIETVIEAARARLEFHQSGEFACIENSMAIQGLNNALWWLGRRSVSRAKRGVSNTYQR